MVDVMSALVFSFIAGLGIAHKDSRTMQKIFQEFKETVSGVITKVIIPLLPLYIFGIFLGMTFSGEAYHILLVFAQIILVILVLHIVILLYEYLLAGGLTHRNPFKLLLNMLPAYFTALGPLASVLGFNADMQALMIALYIAMDSFGTACNVTGDGAIAVIVDKIFRKDK